MGESSIRTVQEITREMINRGAQAAQDAFRQGIRPIYGATKDGRPEHLGSAILLRLSEGPFMLTAAHNLDWNATTSLYLGVRKAEKLELTATLSSKFDGSRDGDVYDFAFARLPDPLVSEIGLQHFIDEQCISKSVADPVGRTYTCLGYPNSKNRTPPHFDTSVSPVMAAYTSNGVSIDRLGQKYRAETHILIDFNFKYSRDEAGKRVCSIKPNGFSGGAVIDIGRLSDPQCIAEPPSPMLIGLFIEAHRDKRAIVATRIAPALEAVRQQGLIC